MEPNCRQAIDLIKQGRWEEAHEIVQVGRDPMACWIHAWLHRQEGDAGNAGCWYSMAGREFPKTDLTSELSLIEQTVESGGN